ncbi:uncharacterized protein APUU_41285A [Aspergillus puulaauensis]|uniref:Uncharacterized protein n=1 Tax=Aspergillus puulaauensis TaxID=1220207 RepID=A0A7R7XNK5_9EURO|nr:uncharacterized protein APUU_41285A [Aspergillus puulaauensis]BCS24841.1 hypothetical protein APUU_41285A [Aspergillus puulaauensis]
MGEAEAPHHSAADAGANYPKWGHNRRPESKISSFVGAPFVDSSDLPLPALRDAVFMHLTSSTAAMEEKIEASEDSALLFLVLKVFIAIDKEYHVRDSLAQLSR